MCCHILLADSYMSSNCSFAPTGPNNVASDAGKLVANLEGQLAVYKSLEKPN